MNSTTKTGNDSLSFVWSVAAEDVRTGMGAPAHETGDCSVFVETRRGEVLVQFLAEFDSSRVFASLRFDLSNGGAQALRLLSSQSLLTLHAVSVDGTLLGTAHAPIGVARRAWLDSALTRTACGASAG